MSYSTFKTILISISSIFISLSPAAAQLIPDRTLGQESSTVVPVSNTRDDIRGGARRGSNLFHSFTEFNVAPDRQVYFSNPVGVQNIINRVTGSNVSNIFGTLGVRGNANLYLINPNGIVFGEGSFLDVNGTFIGTTADGVRLGANDVYSASDPGQSSLLTIQPGALFVNRKNAQIREIRNQGNLEVKPGANLTLSGDSIENQGKINAPGGNVFLEAVNGDINTKDIDTTDALNGGGDIDISASGAITVNGEINASGVDVDLDLNVTRDRLVLNINTLKNVANNSGNVSLLAGDNITFNNGSNLFAVGELGGEINIDTQGLLKVDNASIASVNIRGDASEKSGDITVKASSIELIKRTDFDGFTRGITSRTAGDTNAGNITIDTLSLRALDGARIYSFTNSTGNAGNIAIKADRIELINPSNPDRDRVGIGTETSGAGNAGNIAIDTNTLLVDGAIISTSSDKGDSGDAGNIDINARSSIELINENKGFAGSIRSETKGVGNAGNIKIDTNILRVLDESLISTSTEGLGEGGNIAIRADRIELRNENLSVFVGGILARTEGAGNAGNITIDTNTLQIIDQSVISTTTFGSGQGGNIDINARSIELIEINKLNNVPSILARTTGEGNAGNITIDTNTLHLDGGLISASSTEEAGGAGGDINITARNIELSGPRTIIQITEEGNLRNIELSGIGITARTTGEGKAGNITIATEKLRLDGGSIGAGTGEAGGAGGNINITAGNIELNGAGIEATTNGEGKAGNITIATEKLRLVDLGVILASTQADGAGGDINITAENIESIDSAIFSGTFREGKAGNITIDTNILRLVAESTQSGISTATGGFGAGGDINITAENIELIGTGVNGIPSGLSSAAIDFFSNNTDGNGGDITINTKQLKVLNGAAIDSSNFPSDNLGKPGLGKTGNITIAAEEIVLNQGRITASGNRLGGGTITIDSTNFLSLQDRSEISTDVGETIDFPGGNININTPIIIANPANNRITATAQTSTGGNININTRAILGYPQFLTIDASSNLGFDGTINIEGLSDQINIGVRQLDRSPISAQDKIEVQRCPLKYPKIGAKLDKKKRRSSLSIGCPSKPAVGWYRKTDGTVVLTDDPSKVRPLNQPIDYDN